MHCPNCGNALPDNAAFCSNCGSPVQSQPTGYTAGSSAAPYGTAPEQPSYPNQTTQQTYQTQDIYGYQPQPATPAVPAGSKSKVAAGILGILLGSLGIHKFYLGYTKAGVITLLITLLTFGVGAVVMEVIGVIEGIIYLTKSDYDFYATYVAGEKQWF